MKDENHPGRERLERLLRQWGAEEAVRQEQGAAQRLPPPLPVPAAAWRWVPLAAGFALFAVGVGFLLVAKAEVPKSGARLPLELIVLAGLSLVIAGAGLRYAGRRSA